MKKYRLQKAAIDKFVASIEKMIDARDDMWEAEQRHDYRKKYELEEEHYLPAKSELEEALYDFIVEVMEEEEVA